MKNSSFLLVVAILFVYSERIAASDCESTLVPSIPKVVVEALEQNIKQIETISLKWKEIRTSDVPLESLLRKLKIEYSYGFLGEDQSVFMYREGSAYLFTRGKGKRLSSKSGSRLPPAYAFKEGDGLFEISDSLLEKAIDKVSYYLGTGIEGEVPHLSIWPIEKMILDEPRRGLFSQHLTTIVGFKYPFFGSELKMSPDSYVLFLAREGEVVRISDETLNDQKSLVIQIKAKSVFDWNQKARVFIFWLIPELNYAVKQYEIRTTDNHLCQTILNEDFFKVEDTSVYFPRCSNVTHYTHLTIANTTSATPLFKEQYLLVEASTKNINADLFHLADVYARPGARISNRHFADTDDGLSYTIPANPADLDRVIEAALTGKDFVPTPIASKSAFIVRWGMAFLGLCMIVYALLSMYIKRKTK